MRLPSGQPWWQNGMPQSMQRDACARSCARRARDRRSRASRGRARSTGRSSSSSRGASRKPFGSPMACYLRSCRSCEDASPLVRHHLHEAALRPTIARTLLPRALRVCADVLLDERPHELLVLGVERLEVDHRLADAAGEDARRRRARTRCRRSSPRRSCGPSGPSTTTVPPVMYSHPWSPTPSTTASAPLLRTAKRSPARPAKNALPLVAP